MSVGFPRRLYVYVALVLGLFLVRPSTALAQSDQTAAVDAVTRVTFDAANATIASTIEAPRTSPLLSPTLQASFRASAQSQLGPSSNDSGIGFGILGMITRASFNSDNNVFDLKSRTGSGLGFWVGGNRNGRVGFTGEFIFLTRKVGTESAGGTLKVFEIPAVFHVNFGSRSRNSAGGYVVLGPAFSFNLNKSFTGGFNEDNFGGADFGVIGGLGVEFFRIGIEGRGNWGMTNISSEGSTSDIKTFTFELLGKFAFN